MWPTYHLIIVPAIAASSVPRSQSWERRGKKKSQGSRFMGKLLRGPHSGGHTRALLSWRGPRWLLVAPAYLVLRAKNSTFSFVLGFTTIPGSGLSSSPKTTLHLSSWHVHSGIPTCYCQAWFSMCLPPAKYLPTCLAIWDRWHSHTLPPREYFYYQRWNFHPQRPSHAVHRDVFTLLLSGLPWIQAACPPTHPFLAFPQSRGGREGREEPQPRG